MIVGHKREMKGFSKRASIQFARPLIYPIMDMYLVSPANSQKHKKING